MAKRSAGTGMTRAEKIWGGALLAVYFAVLPVAADPLFDLLEKLFGTAIGGGARDAAYYCVLFGLTLAVFRGYWGRTTRAFLDHIGSVLGAVGLGLVAFYGLNELTWRVLRLIPGERVNLNDQAILARIGSAPHSTILIVVFLAPVVEEAVFRGYVFGNLRLDAVYKEWFSERWVEVMRVSDYNKAAELYGKQQYEVSENEYIIVCDYDAQRQLYNPQLCVGRKASDLCR